MTSPGGSLADDHGLLDALERDDWDAVGPIAERWCVELLSGPHMPLFARAAGTAPEEVLAAYPTLLHGAEAAKLRPVPLEPPTFDKAVLEGGGEAGLLEMRRVGAAVIARRSRGYATEAVAIVDEYLPAILTGIRRTGDLPVTSGSWFLMQAGVAYDIAGDIHAARRTYLLGWQWHEEDSLGYAGRDLASKLAVLAAMEGDLPEAARWAAEGRRLPGLDESVFSSHVDLGYPLAEFLRAHDLLDLDRAEALVGGLTRPTDWVEFFHYLLFARVHLLLAQGRAGEALRLIHDTETTWEYQVRGNGAYAHMIVCLRAMSYLAQSRTDEARALLTDLIWRSSWSVLLLARAAVLEFDHERALTELTRLPDEVPRRVALESQLLKAACLHQLGRDSQAREAFTIFLRSLGDTVQIVSTIAPAVAESLFDLVPDLPLAKTFRGRWEPHRHVSIYPFHEVRIALTERERVLLRRLAAGESRTAIAKAEYVSINTVKTQLTRLFAKFSAATRAELLAKAKSLGFLD